MHEIPGLDGYSGHITDKIFERTALNYDNTNKLNAAFYHRWYRTPDAVGQRSFADYTLFMARNTDHRVLETAVKYCAGMIQIDSDPLLFAFVKHFQYIFLNDTLE